MTLAWELAGFGIDRLELVERAPAPLRPTQVRLRLSAWSLNYRDLMIVAGTYNPRQKLPVVPLCDAAGEVVEIGAAVHRVAVGARVCPIFAQRWIDGPPTREAFASTLGSPIDGVAAREVVVDQDAVVEIPPHLSLEEAATLPCAAVTAWSALVEHGALAPGEIVLVQGSGGVSIFALQLALLAGARVVATSSHEAKRERLKALGAEHVIDYVAEPEWGKRAKALTDGIDHVVEVGGAGTIAQSLIAVRPGGTISVIGVLDGGSGELPLTRVLMNAIRMQGVFVGSRGAFERMNRAITRAALRPVIDRRFAFEELPAALRHLQSGSHFGKVVLVARD